MKKLNIKVEILAIKHPKTQTSCPSEIEGAKVGLYELMYKGRVASKLVQEETRNLGVNLRNVPIKILLIRKVHVDPLGYVHVCQDISIGNAWQKPFSKIIEEHDPHGNPILEPLVRVGPVALVERFSLPHDEFYADACHLCYATRCLLWKKYHDTLAPDQMYREFE